MLSPKSEAIARSPYGHFAMAPNVEKCCNGATDLVANVKASCGAPCHTMDRMLSDACVQCTVGICVVRMPEVVLVEAIARCQIDASQIASIACWVCRNRYDCAAVKTNRCNGAVLPDC